ncbi:MAG: hypothetical protein EA394_04265 [Bacteroidia bacterium]|nr:MAG: hypothetical protein EA394_04265 [Bacteroidia bacterium]
MKKIFLQIPFLICMLAITISSGDKLRAQDIDIESLIIRQHIGCSDIALSATGMIPGMHSREAADSLRTLLSFWESRCGITEPMMRYTILWQILTNSFSDDWLPDRIIDHLLDYRDGARSDEDIPQFFDFRLWEYQPIHPGFNDFTRELAGELLAYNDLTQLERFFTGFYHHDFDESWRMLTEGELSGTRIDSLYQLFQEPPAPPATSAHAGLYIGMWIPNGNLELLGNHPQVGLMLDGVSDHVIYGLHMHIAFSDAYRTYTVMVDNQSFKTNHFMQYNVLVFAGFDVLRSRGYSIYTVFGGGYDGIDPLSRAQREAGMRKAIHSYNLHVGLIYHRRLENNNVFSIITRYNVVDYINKRGTDLSGNVFTLGVGFGLGTW